MFASVEKTNVRSTTCEVVQLWAAISKFIWTGGAGAAAVAMMLLLAGAAAAEADAGHNRGFHKGVTFATWTAEQYATPEGEQALAELAATGATWVSIIVTAYQRSPASTVIQRDTSQTASDASLAHAIATAHGFGLRVMLKPHLDLQDDAGPGRGEIGTGFSDESQWADWFASYRRFIGHYATLAQESGVELFSIGTELEGTTHREEEWREVAQLVREHFSGALTYAANHGGEETAIAWWDTVDYIGVDAYYPLVDWLHPSVEDLKWAWVEGGPLDTLAGLAEQHGRPVLLTELGYRSGALAAAAPWDFVSEMEVDLGVQARAYQAAFEVLLGQPWLAGIYWWYWDADPEVGGEDDSGYSPRGKPALDVLRSFYFEDPPAVRDSRRRRAKAHRGTHRGDGR
jgi:hypothetical protein